MWLTRPLPGLCSPQESEGSMQGPWQAISLQLPVRLDLGACVLDSAVPALLLPR